MNSKYSKVLAKLDLLERRPQLLLYGDLSLNRYLDLLNGYLEGISENEIDGLNHQTGFSIFMDAKYKCNSSLHWLGIEDHSNKKKTKDERINLILTDLKEYFTNLKH